MAISGKSYERSSGRVPGYDWASWVIEVTKDANGDTHTRVLIEARDRDGKPIHDERTLSLIAAHTRSIT